MNFTIGRLPFFTFLAFWVMTKSGFLVSAFNRNIQRSLSSSRIYPSASSEYQGQLIYKKNSLQTVRKGLQPNRRFFSTKNSEEDYQSSSTILTLEIPTAEDTEEVGALFSAIVLQNEKSAAKGSTIFLGGDLGAGKTAFARGFLRGAMGDDELRVTSPTYLLVNVYPIGDDLEIHHMDLYRLSGEPEDFLPLNLPHVFENCVSLIEWPQRLGSLPIIPENRLDVSIHIQSDDNNDAGVQQDGGEDGGEDDKARIMTLQPRGSLWEQRIELIKSEGYLDDLLLL